MIKRLEQGTGSVCTLVAVMQALDYRLTGLGTGASIGEQISRSRIRRGFSRKRLAEKTGLSPTTISAVETGGGSVASIQALLAVLAPKARRRAPERSYWGEGDKHDRDSRFTPPDFMDKIYEAFGAIDLDPCGHELSPVIARQRILLSEGGNGLVEPWIGRLVYVNPPYSKLLVWLRRAHEQWLVGNAETVLCLVPVRTDSAWFHDVLSSSADIYFLRGRVRFLDIKGSGQQTPFSLMLVVLGAQLGQKVKLAEVVPGYWAVRVEG